MALRLKAEQLCSWPQTNLAANARAVWLSSKTLICLKWHNNMIASGSIKLSAYLRSAMADEMYRNGESECRGPWRSWFGVSKHFWPHSLHPLPPNVAASSLTADLLCKMGPPVAPAYVDDHEGSWALLRQTDPCAIHGSKLCWRFAGKPGTQVRDICWDADSHHSCHFHPGDHLLLDACATQPHHQASAD